MEADEADPLEVHPKVAFATTFSQEMRLRSPGRDSNS
jgi:hypothetical protein